MKLKSVFMAAASMVTLGFGASAFASNAGSVYYPPERIHCEKQGTNLHCEGFNHQFLVEDVYTADFLGKDNVFAFESGSAYYTLNKSEVTVLYTYRNKHRKVVRLRSALDSVRPDTRSPYWVKVQDDLYVCKGGYMHCPITI